jgi:hypothetical protein
MAYRKAVEIAVRAHPYHPVCYPALLSEQRQTPTHDDSPVREIQSDTGASFRYLTRRLRTNNYELPK